MAGPITENDLAALTRRYEDTRTDLKQIKHDLLGVKHDLLGVKNDIGVVQEELRAFKTETRDRFDRLETKLDGFITEQRTVNATLVDLLTNLVGRRPEDG